MYSPQTLTLTRCGAMALIAVLAFSSLTACGDMDPDESVTVEVSNLPSDRASDEVLEALKTLHDANARYKRTKSTFNDGTLTVTLAPVSDVDAFARRIEFGKVTEVSGRTVKVSYARSSGIIQI